MAPKSWSMKETADKLGVSDRMVRTAWKIKEEKGICAMPKAKDGKLLAKEVADRVQDFYEDDEFSRMCPGKKKIVFQFGSMVSKSKSKSGCCYAIWKSCLLHIVTNMELKSDSPNFCDLRPKWCVMVGASGTHSVCVCTIHQNVKLMLQGANIKDDYKMLMEKTVCD